MIYSPAFTSNDFSERCDRHEDRHGLRGAARDTQMMVLLPCMSLVLTLCDPTRVLGRHCKLVTSGRLQAGPSATNNSSDHRSIRRCLEYTNGRSGTGYAVETKTRARHQISIFPLGTLTSWE